MEAFVWPAEAAARLSPLEPDGPRSLTVGGEEARGSLGESQQAGVDPGQLQQDVRDVLKWRPIQSVMAVPRLRQRSRAPGIPKGMLPKAWLGLRPERHRVQDEFVGFPSGSSLVRRQQW